jgi:endonuclease YncB( thermonuclease family)
MHRLYNILGRLWIAVILLFCMAEATPARPLIHPPFTTTSPGVPIFMICGKPRVYDGDTIMCASGYHLRLLGVQAPEMKCNPRIECIAGDAVAARDMLAKYVGLGRGVTYQYIRRDDRSRPVVIVRKKQGRTLINLNCIQLQKTDAQLRWDWRGRIASECKLGGGVGFPNGGDEGRSHPPDVARFILAPWDGAPSFSSPGRTAGMRIGGKHE